MVKIYTPYAIRCNFVKLKRYVRIGVSKKRPFYFHWRRSFIKSIRILRILRDFGDMTSIELLFRCLQERLGYIYYPVVGTRIYEYFLRALSFLKKKGLIEKKPLWIRKGDRIPAFLEDVYIPVYSLWRNREYGVYGIREFRAWILSPEEYIRMCPRFVLKFILEYLTTGVSQYKIIPWIARGYGWVMGKGKEIMITKEGLDILKTIHKLLGGENVHSPRAH